MLDRWRLHRATTAELTSPLATVDAACARDATVSAAFSANATCHSSAQTTVATCRTAVDAAADYATSLTSSLAAAAGVAAGHPAFAAAATSSTFACRRVHQPVQVARRRRVRRRWRRLRIFGLRRGSRLCRLWYPHSAT